MPFEQLHVMVQGLLAEAATLCTHLYGNFVIQALLEHCGTTLRTQLLQVIQANLPRIGSDFYGSAVVKAALLGSGHEQRLSLIQAILDVNGLLAAIAHFRHCKSIVELVLSTLHGTEKELALTQLATPRLKIRKADLTR